MKITEMPEHELERRISVRLLDVFVRAGLVLALTLLCYRIFSPFLSLMLWALILAVTMYPIHRRLVKKMRGRQGLAATLLVLAGMVVIVAPASVLLSSLGDSVYKLIGEIRNNTLQIPEPSANIAGWPIVGKQVHLLWSQAHDNLPALVQSMQPKIGGLARQSLNLVAGTGGKILEFLVSFVVAGVIMAYGESGTSACQAIFERVVGVGRGREFVRLSAALIRTVAAGVIGIACIQALLIGLVLIVAGIPLAGIMSLIALVLGIAQLPALLLTLPLIGYIWYSGAFGTGAAIGYSALLLVSGTVDNVLKPLMLGRGVDAPMPVVLLGALGGMTTSGILGMFIGATLLPLGYRIFMWWVKDNPDEAESEPIP